MATIGELDFVVVYYINNAKITRVPCNFLMHDPVHAIHEWWVNSDQQFYTHVAIEYQGQTILHIDLKDQDRVKAHP